MLKARFGNIDLALEGMAEVASEAIAVEARNRLADYEPVVADTTAIGYSVINEGCDTIYVFSQITGAKA